jgi:hypothetical protein
MCHEVHALWLWGLAMSARQSRIASPAFLSTSGAKDFVLRASFLFGLFSLSTDNSYQRCVNFVRYSFFLPDGCIEETITTSD